jgi:hypothetical protein
MELGIDKEEFMELPSRRRNDIDYNLTNRAKEFMRQHPDQAFHAREVGLGLGYPPSDLQVDGSKELLIRIRSSLRNLVDEGYLESAKSGNANYYSWIAY